MAVDAARNRLRQGERDTTCLWRCLGRKREHAADDGGAWVSRRGHWIGYAAGGAQSSTRRGAIAKSFLALIQTSSLTAPSLFLHPLVLLPEQELQNQLGDTCTLQGPAMVARRTGRA